MERARGGTRPRRESPPRSGCCAPAAALSGWLNLSSSGSNANAIRIRVLSFCIIGDMPVPASQMWTVASYVLRQKLKGRKHYPLVLMLEPLYRCNLACAGCGKIQYPGHILKRELTPEECFRAVEECGVPTVAIPGGEPLMHPRIDEIVRGLVARKKYIYLCTNALLLQEKLHLFQPSKYLTFSVHMDGQEDPHDFADRKSV